jgi:hypothetical protein
MHTIAVFCRNAGVATLHCNVAADALGDADGTGGGRVQHPTRCEMKMSWPWTGVVFSVTMLPWQIPWRPSRLVACPSASWLLFRRMAEHQYSRKGAVRYPPLLMQLQFQ